MTNKRTCLYDRHVESRRTDDSHLPVFDMAYSNIPESSKNIMPYESTAVSLTSPTWGK